MSGASFCSKGWTLDPEIDGFLVPYAIHTAGPKALTPCYVPSCPVGFAIADRAAPSAVVVGVIAVGPDVQGAGLVTFVEIRSVRTSRDGGPWAGGVPDVTGTGRWAASDLPGLVHGSCVSGDQVRASPTGSLTQGQ
ncbi:hypothetical protein [Streptomyces sp. NPDC059816]|uniref:hypothetical protein n=1 Tax=Streptomyces sp. NPDC059816 TaxID=3346960 RepID=UPI003657E33A